MLKGLSTRGWIGLAALVFALAGALTVFLLVSRALESTGLLIIVAALIWGAAGAIGWRLLLQRFSPVSVWRGAIAGLIIGLLVHPVVWYLAILVTFLAGVPVPILDQRLNPITGLVQLPWLTLVSWLGTGWITGLVSAIAGGILGYLQAGTFKETEPRSRALRIFRGIGVALAMLVLILLPLGLVPIPTTGITSRPNPAATYDEAMAKLAQIEAEEATLPLLPECRTTLLTHGQQTEKSIVFYHGLTNCPRQFVELGQEFFDLGYNVLIARHPYHVYEGRSPASLAELSAEKYRDAGDRSIDIARGLGQKVVVLGLSGGGTLASWVIQNRSDVERVVSVAPFFGSGPLPAWLSAFGTNLLSRIPPIPLYSPGVFITHAITGNNTRAMGETMRLGLAARNQADAAAPLVKSILLVTNANDRVVDNDMARALNSVWQSKGVAAEAFEFPESMALPHDVVDVQQPTLDIEIVYPMLIDLVEGREPRLP
jgi:pimeloyl-ACP methyl ester carboxylesterase